MMHENFSLVQVIRYPKRQLLLVATLLSTLGFAALETILISRAPWWRLPWAAVLLWVWIAFLCFSPFAYWILNAKPWAYRGLQVFAVTWLIASAWVSFRMRYTGLAIFTVILAAYWAFFFNLLKRELGQSFFDPWTAWYMGSPEALPRIKCEVVGLGKVFSVCRLDEKGVFVIGFNPPAGRERVMMRLHWGELKADVVGLPTVRLRGRGGVGYEFVSISSDQNKRLGDFIEGLRGEGYVS